MKTKKIRILVVDDENVVREGFVAILRLQQDIQVVGEALDGIQAVEMARKTKAERRAAVSHLRKTVGAMRHARDGTARDRHLL